MKMLQSGVTHREISHLSRVAPLECLGRESDPNRESALRESSPEFHAPAFRMNPCLRLGYGVLRQRPGRGNPGDGEGEQIAADRRDDRP